MNKTTTHGQQTLTLKGLGLKASLGILPEEINHPQPIEVSVKLNLGTQPLAPKDDDISNVLDYRLARDAIINTCTKTHVDLLESLTGQVAHSLMALPSVVGVWVEIIKLEIFDDCEVAIQMEVGQW